MRLRRVTATAAAFLSLALSGQFAAADAPTSVGDCGAAEPEQPEIVSMVVTPEQRPVGISKPRPLTFEVTFRDDCRLAHIVEVHNEHLGGGGHAFSEIDLQWDSSNPDANGLFRATATVTIDPRSLTTDQAGRWTSFVAIRNQDEGMLSSRTGPNWDLQRWSMLTNNASEPARKGTKIHFTGHLRRANWDAGAYHDAPRQDMSWQKRAFDGSYGSMFWAGGTDGHGLSTQKLIATSSACFRYVFAGTSTTMPVKARGDCVEVY